MVCQFQGSVNIVGDLGRKRHSRKAFELFFQVFRIVFWHAVLIGGLGLALSVPLSIPSAENGKQYFLVQTI